jgi:hypothetical protein
VKRLALLALAACSSHADAPAEPPPAPRVSIDARSAEADVLARALDADHRVPAAFRRVPAPVAPPITDDARRRALAGAWLLRTNVPNDVLVAFDFDGDRARTWDGEEERSYRLRLDACQLWLETGTGGHGYTFALRRGVAVFGMGVAGQLERGVATVCDGGTPGRAQRKDAAGTTFVYREPAFGDELVLHAADDLLWDDQLAREHAEPVVDYATAAAIVTNQPAAIAIRAGGRLGDTATVAGLVATVALGRASMIGRSVDVSGIVLDAASTTMNGERSDYVDLHTPADPFHPGVACFTRGSPLGAVHPDQVVRVRGRVEKLDANGVVTLRPCALLP